MDRRLVLAGFLSCCLFFNHALGWGLNDLPATLSQPGRTSPPPEPNVPAATPVVSSRQEPPPSPSVEEQAVMSPPSPALKQSDFPVTLSQPARPVSPTQSGLASRLLRMKDSDEAAASDPSGDANTPALHGDSASLAPPADSSPASDPAQLNKEPEGPIHFKDGKIKVSARGMMLSEILDEISNLAGIKIISKALLDEAVSISLNYTTLEKCFQELLEGKSYLFYYGPQKKGEVTNLKGVIILAKKGEGGMQIGSMFNSNIRQQIPPQSPPTPAPYQPPPPMPAPAQQAGSQFGIISPVAPGMEGIIARTIEGEAGAADILFQAIRSGSGVEEVKTILRQKQGVINPDRLDSIGDALNVMEKEEMRPFLQNLFTGYQGSQAQQ